MDTGIHSTHISQPDVQLSRRSRWALRVLRWLVRPLMSFIVRGGPERIAKAQLRLAGRFYADAQGPECNYKYWESSDHVVPGHALGEPFSPSGRPVVLWLHGGAFIFPAVPEVHLTFVQRLRLSLSADAFIPDYRLAPSNPYPWGLNDCEQAYRMLLDSGVSANRIVLGGESAGGNLLIALLFRLRSAGLPMPACAVAVSPVLDLARLHGAPSRSRLAGSDAMLPFASLARVRDAYVGNADSAQPEISPLLGEFQDLPPLLIQASDAELLRDDSVFLAQRARAAGVPTKLALWPAMPHAFPLLENWLTEAAQARTDIASFIRQYIH